MPDIKIHFVDATTGAPIERTVSIPMDSGTFSDWKKNIIAEVKNQYGVQLDAKEIPQIKIRLRGLDGVDPGTAISSDHKKIDPSEFTEKTFISTRIPASKLQQIQQAKLPDISKTAEKDDDLAFPHPPGGLYEKHGKKAPEEDECIFPQREKFLGREWPLDSGSFTKPMRKAFEQKNEKAIKGLIRGMKEEKVYEKYIQYIADGHYAEDLKILTYIQDNKLFPNEKCYQEAFLLACKNGEMDFIRLLLKNRQYELPEKVLEGAIKNIPEEIKRIEEMDRKMWAHGSHHARINLIKHGAEIGKLIQEKKKEQQERKAVTHASISIAQGMRASKSPFHKLPDVVGGKIAGFLSGDPKLEEQATKNIKKQIGKKKP